MKINYLEHEKVHKVYNPATDEVEEINPAPPRPVDFGRPNADRIVKLIGYILLAVWALVMNWAGLI